jgi:hypothetical protein
MMSSISLSIWSAEALHRPVLVTETVPCQATTKSILRLTFCLSLQKKESKYKTSVKSATSEGDLPLFLACEMPETSLDTIFLLMKLYPDVVVNQ